jgi:hypothetical protein
MPGHRGMKMTRFMKDGGIPLEAQYIYIAMRSSFQHREKRRSAE